MSLSTCARKMPSRAPDAGTQLKFGPESELPSIIHFENRKKNPPFTQCAC
jgi:hypothetical protein